MRKLIFLFMIFFNFLCLSQVKENLEIPPNPKIGLSLSGGGAKGFAHIGVLKVIDSLGIKIDYVSGTSMGAIIGGLYASGYKAKDIEEIVMKTDFYTLIANEKNRQESTFFNKITDKYLITVPIKDGKFLLLPKAISTGQKNIYLLKELFKNSASVEDFSKLPIPFMCVATNLESGKMEVFERGDLIKSIMASSAFPSLMDPVKIGDSLYIDGAMTVNYPSKPLKDKSIDIVIGVDLSQGLAKSENLHSAVDILNQVIDFGIQKETKNQYQYTDINIHPDLKGKSATSYNEKKAILDSGYVEAQKYEAILATLPKRKSDELRASISNIYTNVYKIDALEVVNGKIFNKKYVRGKMGLDLPSLQTYGNINQMIEKLYATKNYEVINYDLVSENGINTLKVNVTEDNTRYFLKFGLHYDDVFKTGLLINFTGKRLLFKNSNISFDGIIGDKPRYYFNYFIDNGYIPGLGIYASGMYFDLKNDKGNRMETWNWFRNEIYIQSVWKEKYAIGGGLSHDYYERKKLIDTYSYEGEHHYISPYIFIKSDTQNDQSLATKGIYMNAEGKLLELFNDEVEEKTLQLKGDFKLNFPIKPWLTYRLNLYGGFTLADNVDYYYYYRPGGIFGQNLNNFVPFAGYYFGELYTKNVMTASNEFQFRFMKNIYAIASFNMMNQFEDISIEDAFNITDYSAGITAAYKSPFGPIKINYSIPFNNKKGIFNVVLGYWF